MQFQNLKINRFSYLVSFCAWIDAFKSSFLATEPFVNNSSFSIAHCNVACQPLWDVGLGDCLMSCFWDCCLRNMMTLCEKANFLFHLNSFIKPRILGKHMIFRERFTSCWLRRSQCSTARLICSISSARSSGSSRRNECWSEKILWNFRKISKERNFRKILIQK